MDLFTTKKLNAQIHIRLRKRVLVSGSEHLMILRITTSLKTSSVETRKEHHFHIIMNPPQPRTAQSTCNYMYIDSHVCSDWASLINRLSNNIDDPTKCFRTHRDLDGRATVVADLTTNQTFSTVHSNSTHRILTCACVCVCVCVCVSVRLRYGTLYTCTIRHFIYKRRYPTDIYKYIA